MTTTFRADSRDGAATLLSGFAAANPTFGLRTYRSRPAAFGDRPLAFVGSLSERINHTGTTLYQRQLAVQFVFVWASGADQRELAEVRDDLIDAFIGYAMARPHAISSKTVSTPTGVEDVELDLDGAFYPASIVTSGDTLALEGSA